MLQALVVVVTALLPVSTRRSVVAVAAIVLAVASRTATTFVFRPL